MVDLKKGTLITELPLTTGLSGNEVVPVVQGGTTKQATINQMAFAVGPTGPAGPAGPQGPAGSGGNTPRGPTLTISTGAITVTANFHYVDTQAGGPWGELDTINGGTDGMRVTFALATAGHRVWLANGTGNILCGNGGTSGFLLWGKGSVTAPDCTITLMYDGTRSLWIETARYEGRAYGGVKNVKDYGAVGDGQHDDTAAIQAAINDADPGFDQVYQSNLILGTILFPAGTYKITSTINLPDVNMKLLGEANACLLGNFNGYLISCNGGFSHASKHIENLRLENDNNTAVTSGCIFASGALGLLVEGCSGGTQGGIWCNGAVCSNLTGINNILDGGGTTSTSVGFKIDNPSVLIDNDIIAFGTAIRHGGIGGSIIGGRYETNGIGINLGVDQSGNNEPSTNVLITGCSMESNNVHIKIGNSSGVTISNCGGSSFNAGNTHGLWVQTVSGLCLMNVGFSGGYSVAAIFFENDDDIDLQFTGVHCINVGASNTTAGKPAWLLSNQVDTTTWVNTNYTPAFTNVYNIAGVAFGTTHVRVSNTATISAGAFTVSGNYMVIDTGGGAANLTTINGAGMGQIGGRLIIRSANNANVITVKDGTGNLALAGDCVLSNIQDTLSLIWDNDQSMWLETGRSING